MKDCKNVRKTMGIDLLLACMFIVLKLVGTIKWSWIWVLSPIWISLLVHFVFIVLIQIRDRKIW